MQDVAKFGCVIREANVSFSGRASLMEKEDLSDS